MSPAPCKRNNAVRRRLRIHRPTWRGWFAIGLSVAVVAIVTAWAIDYATLGDRVVRNVTVENVDLGRHGDAGLAAAIDRADTAYGQGDVVFVIGGEPHPMSASEIGLHLNADATAAAAKRVGRDDPALLKPVFWATSFFQARRPRVTIELDRAKLTSALATLPGQTPVVEPHVTGSVESIGTTPGSPGYGFDPETVAAQIERAARDGGLPLRIPLATGIIQPTVSDAEVEMLAAHARELTDRDIELAIPGANMVATPPLLRSWISSRVVAGGGHAELTMEADAVVRDAQAEMGTVITRPVDATYTVEDSEVYLVPQVDGLECCAESSGDEIVAALEADRPAVDLPLVERPPEFTTAKARELGITTRLGAGTSSDAQRIWSPDPDPPGPVPTDGPPGDDGSDRAGTSTTTSTSTSTTTTTTVPPDPASIGQFIVPIPDRSGQVRNVDTALPMLNGRIIMPGEKLSLNDVIGAPSPERDFVPANVETADGPTWISGGGTGLIAAALFEAAYHSGLDIPTWHPSDVLPAGVSPGIEATIGWTEPDLVIENPEETAVLIWADRVAGGVRIQLFGTPFVEPPETSTKTKGFGPEERCLDVTVTRTRRFLDGSDDVVDRFSARYTPPPGARDDPDRVICTD